jgi:hypothetical protein
MNEKLIEYLVGGKRFTELKGYRFDKLIFGSFIMLVMALFLIMFIAFGSDRGYHIYYVCDAGGQPFCSQPFYKQYPICESAWVGACDSELVLNGFEFGDPAPWIIKNWGLIIGSLLAGAFFVNHFVHNKYFKFGGDVI